MDEECMDEIIDKYVASALPSGYRAKKCAFKERFIAGHESEGNGSTGNGVRRNSGQNLRFGDL